MNFRKLALHGFGWSFLQQFSTLFISIGVSIWMARILEPRDFGILGMVAIITAISQTLIDSGLSQSLIRTNSIEEDDYNSVFVFSLIFSLFLYCFIYFLSPYVSKFYQEESLVLILRILALNLFFSPISIVIIARFTRKLDFKTQLKANIPALVISSILGITLALDGHGVWSLIYMGLVNGFINMVLLLYYTDWRPKISFNKIKFLRHFDFGYKLMISGILDTIFVNIYSILIGKYFSATQVGLYLRADQMKQLPVANTTSALLKTTYPLMSKFQDDDIRLKNVFKKITQVVIFIIAPVMIFMNVLAEPLFMFLFTDKWNAAIPYFQILCITGLLYPIHGLNLNILKVKGKSGVFLALEVYKKILLVIILFITIRYGVIGLLWGQLIFSFIILPLNIFYSGKFISYNFKEQILDILPSIIIAVAIGLIIKILDNYNASEQIGIFLRLLIGGTFGIVSYYFTAKFFKLNAYSYAVELYKSKNKA